VLAVCPVLSGCTLIGLAIGASRPTYKEMPSPSAVPLDERVRLTVRTPEPAAPVEPVAFGPPAPDATLHATEDITGRFRGIEDGWVRLDTSWTYGQKIRADRVERVRVTDGNYWAAGHAVSWCQACRWGRHRRKVEGICACRRPAKQSIAARRGGSICAQRRSRQSYVGWRP
jgi:hypothetical protein